MTPSPTPPQAFVDWWQEHTAHTGNTYSARVAFEAIRCFVMESEAMSQAGQMIGRSTESARIQAINTLTRKLGVGLTNNTPEPNKSNDAH